MIIIIIYNDSGEAAAVARMKWEYHQDSNLKSYTRNFIIAHGSWTFPKSNWFWSIVLWDHREGMWCASYFGRLKEWMRQACALPTMGFFGKGAFTRLLCYFQSAFVLAFKLTHCIVDIRWLHKRNRVAFTGPIVIRPSMHCGNWHGWSSLLESSKGCF